MERFPTELMVEVVGYSSKSTIRSFTIVSRKYREIAQPLLFRRIFINKMAEKRLALFVEKLENRVNLLYDKNPVHPNAIHARITPTPVLGCFQPGAARHAFWRG